MAKMSKTVALKRLNEADNKIWNVLNGIDTSKTGSAWKAGLITASKHLVSQINKLKKM